jgi:hypothetical protein
MVGFAEAVTPAFESSEAEGQRLRRVSGVRDEAE